MKMRFTDPPEEFTELVRDALLNVYDPTVLQRHPLLAVAGESQAHPDGRSRWLRQALLEAVSALHPGVGVSVTSRAWRTFRILELRYLEGQEVGAVSDQVALSKSQYHREHHRALQAVAGLLWERWCLDDRWPPPEAPGRASPDQETQTQLEIGRLRPELGTADRIDLLELARGLRQTLQPLCREHGIVFDLKLPDHLPAITGERVVLRHALLPILIHAITTAHGPVRAVFAAHGQRVQIEISGDAPHRSALEQRVLSESKPFVEELHGRLRYLPVSDRPEGWTIQLSLPSSQHATLLVVDNHADFVRLIQRYLSEDQWEVIGAADVEQAISCVRRLPPQAILLDVVLPGRDGWELLLELKSRPTTRDIPVLVCSVLHEPAMALALGATAYLHKPIDQRQLLATLMPLG